MHFIQIGSGETLGLDDEDEDETGQDEEVDETSDEEEEQTDPESLGAIYHTQNSVILYSEKNLNLGILTN